MGLDEEVIKHVTSSNVACGYHAGDPVWMQHTVNLAKENGVAIGAHPSYPDLLGFGRRNMTATPEEARAYVKYQVGALQGFLGGAKLQHVKAHGALYNAAVKNDDLAKGICQAILDIDPEIILVVLAGTNWVKIGKEMGNRIAQETFADRAFNADGTLVARSVEGSVLHDPDVVVERSLKMVTEGTINGYHGRRDPHRRGHYLPAWGQSGGGGTGLGDPEAVRGVGGGGRRRWVPSARVLSESQRIQGMPLFSELSFRNGGDRSLFVEVGDEITPEVNRGIRNLLSAIDNARPCRCSGACSDLPLHTRLL